MKHYQEYKSVDHFVSKQRELLKLEQDEEVRERQQMYKNQPIKDLVKKGVCVNRLQIDHQNTGLYGKHVVVFTLNQIDGGPEHMASHRLTSGDIVGLYPNKGDDKDVITSGLISHSRPNTISVAFNEVLELSSSQLYRLMKLTNDVTYRRLNRAIEEISKAKIEDVHYLDLIFPCQRIEEQNSSIVGGEKINIFFNQGLDESQREAVKFVVSCQQPMTVIHGPPGTGKTTTVVEVVRQEVKKFHRKILVCAPSNIAVDNLVERVAKADLKVVRLGHPARVIEEVQKHSLDAILDSCDSSNIIKDVKAEINALCSSKSRERGRQKWDEVKKLKKELINRQVTAMTSVLERADVVLATTTGASLEGPLKHLPVNHFDLLIIDEAAQATEISCWIPLLQVKRCVLVGDHFQLPPTIISGKAAKDGLETTLLERIVQGLGENVVKMLTVQYRMNKLIMEWPSQQLYQNKLLAAEMVADHTLCDLYDVKKTENTENPFVFVDTAGCHMYELEESDEESRGNSWEVDIIYKHVEDLVNDGLPMRHIGVITPYNLQVEMLRQKILPKFSHVEINSVDGFQGREKEAILISLVRSNEDGEIGFLKEDRRINVAITRARRHLFVVGDSVTISNHAFLESLCTFMFEKAIVRSPMYEDGMTKGSTQIATNSNLCEFELKSDIGETNDPKSFRRYVEQKTSKQILRSKEAKSLSNSKGHRKVEKPTDSVSSDSTVEKWEIILEERLQAFLKSSEQTFEFCSSLSSKERFYVHERAEILGLNHLSQGEGQQRRIMVTKKEIGKNFDIAEENVITTIDETTTNAKVTEKTGSNTVNVSYKETTETDFIDEGKLSDTIFEGNIPSQTNITCSNCQVSVPKNNFQLHQLRCSRIQQQQIKASSEINKANGCSEKSEAKKKNKKPSKMQNTEKKKEENVDELLDEFTKLNSRCHFIQCKTSIKTLGQKCEYCGQVFCLTHHMAEVHGCGSAAKVKARQDISKFVDNRPRPMNTVKKAQVQRKLDKKLEEMQTDRKRKSKKK